MSAKQLWQDPQWPVAATSASPHGSLQPRRAYSDYEAPPEEWISIAVPAIVDEDRFAAAHEQLQANRRQARQRRRGAKYLLQGLLGCKGCGYGYYGKAISRQAAKGNPRNYAYYRCIGTDAYRFGGEKVCGNTQVRTDRLDLAVWSEVRQLLEHPERVVAEHRRRLQPQAKRDDLSLVEAQSGKLRRGVARLIDSYAEGLIEKKEFEPRIHRLRQRLGKLEQQAQQLADEAALQADLKLIIGRLEEVSAKVKDELDKADGRSQRELIRALVKRVKIDQEQVNVVFRVDQRPFESCPEKSVLQHCRRSTLATACQSLP